jgi:hypothetical protein
MVKTPTNIVAGETFLVQCDDLDYTAVALALRGPSSVNATATLDGGDFWQFTLDSTAWNPGSHQFELWGTLATGQKTFVGRFPLTVYASLVGMTGVVDVRTVIEKNVDALEAYIGQIGQSDADQGVLRYKINNRELENYPLFEIRRLLAFWRKRLIRERRKERGLAGPGPSMKAHI